MSKRIKTNILALVMVLLTVLMPQTVFAAEGDAHQTANLSPSIIANAYSVDGDVVSGGDFRLNVELKNTSPKIDVQNVLIRVSGGDAFSINNGTDTVYTDKIAKAGTYKFSKNMFCSSAAEAGAYPVNVAVSYEYFDGDERFSGSSEFSISIKVNKKAEPATSGSNQTAALTPQVLISNFSFGGDRIQGGTNFTLNFKINNNSSSTAVKNVIIKLGGGEAFVVADGTDTIALNSLSAGASKQISKQFQCLNGVKSGVYPVTASISYEYFEGGEKAQGTAELTMSIPVVQPDIVFFEGIDLADKTINTNQESDCAFQIINSGQTKLSNGRVILKDENGTELGSAFIGNLEAGTQFSSNYTLPVTFEQSGVKNLTLVLEYENESAEKKSIEQQFRVTVEEYQDPYEDIGMGNEAENAEKSSPVVPIICAAAGVIVLAVAAVVIAKVVKKKKAQKGSDFIDEEI